MKRKKHDSLKISNSKLDWRFSETWNLNKSSLSFSLSKKSSPTPPNNAYDGCRLSNLLIQWDLILCKLIKKHHLYAWYIKSGGFLVFGFRLGFLDHSSNQYPLLLCISLSFWLHVSITSAKFVKLHV